MNDGDDAEIKARQDYDRALRQAFWRKLRRALTSGCNDLLPTGRVFKHLDLENRHKLGIQDVPLSRIVGSFRNPAQHTKSAHIRHSDVFGDHRLFGHAECPKPGCLHREAKYPAL